MSEDKIEQAQQEADEGLISQQEADMIAEGSPPPPVEEAPTVQPSLSDDDIKLGAEQEMEILRKRLAELESEIPKKKLIVLPFRNAARSLQRPGRSIKMVKPVCNNPILNPGEADCIEKGGKWWEKCDHEPYLNIVSREVKTPKLSVNAAGETVLDGYETKILYEKTPRTIQVGLALNINSGRGIEQARAKGHRFLEEQGYAPVCQFWNCWDPNLRVFTENGAYCSRDEAALIELLVNSTAIEVFDMKARRAQLRGVQV